MNKNTTANTRLLLLWRKRIFEKNRAKKVKKTVINQRLFGVNSPTTATSVITLCDSFQNRDGIRNKIQPKKIIMSFDKENFIKSYQKYLIELVQDSLRNDIYKYVSSSYLMVTISGKQFEFIKKYFRGNNNYDDYKNDRELNELISTYSNFSFSIILNYYHNKLDFKTSSTLNTNYFNDISKSLDLETGNEIRNYLNTYKNLNNILLKFCNSILIEDSLKTNDIYTLRNEILNKIESQNNFSWDRNDFFSVETNKIDNIFSDTLRLFEEENKNYTQLFEYIPLTTNDELKKYKIFCEVVYKNQLLPLILNSKINQSKSLFLSLSKDYKIENIIPNSKMSIEDLEKQVINILNQKHIKININPDEFDI